MSETVCCGFEPSERCDDCPLIEITSIAQQPAGSAPTEDELRAMFEAWWGESRLKTWMANSHPQWANSHTEANMPDDWGKLFKHDCEDAWFACARALSGRGG